MTEFMLHILEADGTFYNGSCVSIVVPTTEGLYGIQAKHENMIAAITTGTVKYTTPDGEEHYAAVAGGLIKVEDNDVLLLTESAEHSEEIDENRARKEAEAALEEMKEKKNLEEYRIAQARMARAINRLKVKQKYGTKL